MQHVFRINVINCDLTSIITLFFLFFFLLHLLLLLLIIIIIINIITIIIFLPGKPTGKRPLVRPRRRWEDNIRMELEEIGINAGN